MVAGMVAKAREAMECLWHAAFGLACFATYNTVSYWTPVIKAFLIEVILRLLS